MNPRHCLSAHPPNPPFQADSRGRLACSFWLLPRGGLNGVVRPITKIWHLTVSVH